MTIATAGSTNPRVMEANGMVELSWAYGPQYRIDRCDPANRTVGPTLNRSYSFVNAGIALDEWVGANYPDVFKWIAEGTRAGAGDIDKITIQPNL